MIQDKIRILVVDDEKEIRNGFREVLSLEEDLIVETADSKDGAIRHFKNCKKQGTLFDITLLDNYLPEPDAGLELLEYIAENSIDTIVLMISSQMDVSSQPFRVGMRALECGAVDFISKPVDKPELIQRSRLLVGIKKKANAMIANANIMGVEQMRPQLEELLEERNLDMLTRSKIKALLSGDTTMVRDQSFSSTPRDIKVWDPGTKPHNSMWNKTIKGLGDIPEPARSLFSELTRHRMVTEIEIGRFRRAGKEKNPKFKMRPPHANTGLIDCTYYGPSPIDCSQQDFFLHVESGHEEKVVQDLKYAFGSYHK